ncbi:uncharacterized protein LOC131687077 [Topomyia yanbarensis]|uniref:uncharacterized protein LOC131687077 n=1 Tax=Topomyia yanbarensis TaxID=2498891 RepID=UPI00273CB1F5|nr:uncharacterized protein LOC131687077 [Topomyia yanbarensis]
MHLSPFDDPDYSYPSSNVIADKKCVDPDSPNSDGRTVGFGLHSTDDSANIRSSFLQSHVPCQARIKSEQQRCRKLENTITQLKRQLFVCRQQSARRLKSKQAIKRKFFRVQTNFNELKRLKSDNEQLGEQIRLNPIIFDCLRNMKRKPKGRRYHRATMKFAAGTYMSGPRAYRYIRKSNHLILPHKNSIHRHNRIVRIAPGLNEQILAIMKTKAKQMREKGQRVVIISCDGMSLKADLAYSAKADVFFGFPDSGKRRKIERNDVTKLATEAVTVMVSGLYVRFKQPIGYLLAHHSPGSQGLLEFIKKAFVL